MALNLIEVLQQRGIPYKPHSSRDDEIWICCPFCLEEGTTPDTRFRLGVNLSTGWMHCFNGGCEKSSKSPEYTWRELARVLDSGQLEAAIGLVKRSTSTNKKIQLPEDFRLVEWKSRDHWSKVAYDYLKSRGVTPAQIKDKQIGYSLVGEFRYRIVIPVFYKRKLVGLVGRSFVRDLEPKYKNSIGQKVLYNVPDEKLDSAILVEGVFDALACDRSVGDNYDCLGVLGHSLTEKQLEQLKSYQRIVLWPDPDKPGVLGFLKMGKQLEDDYQVEMVLPKLDGRTEYDPSDLDGREIRKMVTRLTMYGPEVEDRMRTALVFQED